MAAKYMPDHYERPSERLATELDEVKRDAIALVDYVDNTNIPIPKEFPKARLIQLANLMFELPDCTAQGCREPLLFAQEKLAALRSEHIAREEVQTSPRGEDEVPRLVRREPLDDRITALMSSVSTALQAVNREIAAEPEAETRPDQGIETPHDDASKRIRMTVRKGEKGLTTHRAEFDQMRLEESVNADRLRRRLTDALSLNQLASAELAMPRIVPSWLVRVGNTLREYPKLIIGAATAIQTSADVADWAHDKWVKYREKLFKVGTSLIREVSVDIARYGHDLDIKRKQRLTPVSNSQISEDFSEEKARELIIAGQKIPNSWERKIASLDFQSTSISDLSGLANLENLEYLRLGFTRVSDLSPLIGLRNLKFLELSGTYVEDLGPIAFLPGILRLDLDGSMVSRIQPLSNLKSLQRLDLARTKVVDIGPLERLYNLRYLDLSRTRIKDIRPIRHLDNLMALDLSFTQVDEFVSIVLLKDLKELHLTGTKIKHADIVSAGSSFINRLESYSPP